MWTLGEEEVRLWIPLFIFKSGDIFSLVPLVRYERQRYDTWYTLLQGPAQLYHKKGVANITSSLQPILENMHVIPCPVSNTTQNMRRKKNKIHAV